MHCVEDDTAAISHILDTQIQTLFFGDSHDSTDWTARSISFRDDK